MAKLYLPLTELTLYADLHRSGWSWVLNNLYNDSDIIAKPTESYDPEQDSSLVLLDSYIDRTFHWDYNLLKSNGVLPYTRKWIGFIHHPFDSTYTAYNSSVLFSNPDFIASLKHCQGLFVLSDYMHILLQENLYALASSDFQYASLVNVPTASLVHPTSLTSPQFTLGNFLFNSNKKIVQIGTWLRDTYAIYKLPDLSIFNLQKALLLPVNSDPITKPEGFDPLFQQFTSDYEPFDDTNVIATSPYVDAENPNLSNAQANLAYYSMKPALCRSIDSTSFGGNKYIKGVYDNYQKMDAEVQIIPTLTNDDFDNLLSRNIVYLQLYDASAINTVNECIARGTPLLINPLPAVVELLGSDYPFYYDQNSANDVNQSKFNLFSLRTIERVHAYLNKMDKTPFQISTFIDQFVNSDIISSL